MSRIILDAATADALRHAEPGAELIGPDGQTVGGFVPRHILPEIQHVLQERCDLQDEAADAVTLEQLQAADAEGGEIPMAEVFKLLEKHGG